MNIKWKYIIIRILTLTLIVLMVGKIKQSTLEEKKKSTEKENIVETTEDESIQIVKTSLRNHGYAEIKVEVGKSVRWIIDADKGSINRCNKTLMIPDYDVEITLKEGKNVIEFTASEVGKVRYHCWMQMLESFIYVVPEEDVKATETEEIKTKKINVKKKLESAFTEDATYGKIQTVNIEVSDQGFAHDVVVLEPLVRTIFQVNSTALNRNEFYVPSNNSRHIFTFGKTELVFFPTEDFQIYASDGSSFLYVAVVEDIQTFDEKKITSRIRAYEVSQKE